MKTVIKDGQNRPLAYIVECGNIIQLFDKYGSKLIANYNKSNNATYTANGRLVGKGNLLQMCISFIK
jgi:hypothetical protein